MSQDFPSSRRNSPPRDESIDQTSTIYTSFQEPHSSPEQPSQEQISANTSLASQSTESDPRETSITPTATQRPSPLNVNSILNHPTEEDAGRRPMGYDTRRKSIANTGARPTGIDRLGRSAVGSLGRHASIPSTHIPSPTGFGSDPESNAFMRGSFHNRRRPTIPSDHAGLSSLRRQHTPRPSLSASHILDSQRHAFDAPGGSIRASPLASPFLGGQPGSSFSSSQGALGPPDSRHTAALNTSLGQLGPPGPPPGLPPSYPPPPAPPPQQQHPQHQPQNPHSQPYHPHPLHSQPPPQHHPQQSGYPFPAVPSAPAHASNFPAPYPSANSSAEHAAYMMAHDLTTPTFNTPGPSSSAMDMLPAGTEMMELQMPAGRIPVKVDRATKEEGQRRERNRRASRNHRVRKKSRDLELKRRVEDLEAMVKEMEVERDGLLEERGRLDRERNVERQRWIDERERDREDRNRLVAERDRVVDAARRAGLQLSPILEELHRVEYNGAGGGAGTMSGPGGVVLVGGPAGGGGDGNGRSGGAHRRSASEGHPHRQYGNADQQQLNYGSGGLQQQQQGRPPV